MIQQIEATAERGAPNYTHLHDLELVQSGGYYRITGRNVSTGGKYARRELFMNPTPSESYAYKQWHMFTGQ